MVMLSVDNEIYHFKEDSLDYLAITEELIQNLSTLNPKNNSVTQYYKNANFYNTGINHMKSNYDIMKTLLLNEKNELKCNGKTHIAKSQLLSYYIQYKYLVTFRDVWYNTPHKMLHFSDDYLQFIETIPFFRDNNFFYDDNVLYDNFKSDFVFPLEKLFLGDKSENLDMYLVQLDKRVCSEILKNQCESPDYLSVENEMFFKLVNDSILKNQTVLIVYF